MYFNDPKTQGLITIYTVTEFNAKLVVKQKCKK